VKIAEIVRAKNIYGIDIDEKKLEEASKRGLRTFKVDLNCDKIPFPNDFFDLVTAFEVLEHLVKPGNALREVHRVLKPKGYFVITVPNMASLASRIEFLLGRYPYGLEYSTETLRSHSWFKFKRLKPVGHVRGYTLWALEDLLDYHQFKITKVCGINCKPSRYILYPIYLVSSIKPTFAEYLFLVCRKH